MWKRRNHSNGDPEVTLYIVGIPPEMSEDELKELFSCYGDVRKVLKGQPKEGKGGKSYGFVHYGTLEEAERAITGLDKKPPLYLGVKVAEPRADIQNKKDSIEKEGYSKASNKMNHLLPIRVTVSRTSDEHHVTCINESENMNCLDSNVQSPFNSTLTLPALKKSSLCCSALRTSNDCQYCMTDELHTHVIKIMGRGVVQETIVLDNYPWDGGKEKKCAFCNSSAIFMCSGCQDWYCSQKCQQTHWPQHKNHCAAKVIQNKELKTVSEESLAESTTLLENNFSSESTTTNGLRKLKDAWSPPKANKITAARKCNLVAADPESPLQNAGSSLENNKSFNKSPRRNEKNMGKMKERVDRETLPEGITTKVILSYTTGPGNIWLQKLENLEELTMLFQDVQNYATSVSNSNFEPAVDSICAAKFKEDNLFYRAQITKVLEGGIYEVNYIDYGNSSQVALNDLFPIHSDLLSLPAQAIHCAISGVKLTSVKNVSVNDTITGFLQPKAIATVIGKVSNEKLLVELKNLEGILLKDYLVQHKLVEPLEDAKSPAPSSLGTPPMPVVGPKSPVPLHSSLNNSQNVEPRTCQMSSASIQSSQINIHNEKPLVASVFERIAVNQELHFVVIAVEKCSKKVYLTAALLPEFETFALMDLNNKRSSSYDLNFRPRKGDLVAALSLQYDCCYRAVILEEKANGYEVLYVDYGNKEIVSKVFPLSSEETSLNSLLVVGHVAPSASPTDEEFLYSLEPNIAVSYFVRSVSKNALELAISRDSNIVLLGRPWYYEIQNSKTQETKMASHSMMQRLAHAVMKKSCPRIMAKDIKKRTLKNKFMGIVVDGETIPTLCIQMCEEEIALKNMMADLNSHFPQTEITPYNAVDDEVVCVKRSQDEKWYRGKVISVDTAEGGRRAYVSLVDFGYIEHIRVDNIQPLPESFKSHPFYCFGVKLHAVPDNYLSSDVLTILRAQPWTIEVVSKADDISVKLHSEVEDAAICINDVLLQGTESKEQAGGDNCQAEEVATKLHFSTFPSQNLELGQMYELIICNIVSPNQIFCIVKSQETLQKLVKLNAELSKYCTSVESDKKYVPEAEEMCIAKSSEENDNLSEQNWFRASAIQVVGDEVSCLFVDTGALEVVKTCDLRRLPPQYATFPRQMLMCALRGAPLKSQWEDSKIQELNKLLPLHTPHNAVLISRGESVDFIVSFPDIANTLSKKGFFA